MKEKNVVVALWPSASAAREGKGLLAPAHGVVETRHDFSPHAADGAAEKVLPPTRVPPQPLTARETSFVEF